MSESQGLSCSYYTWTKFLSITYMTIDHPSFVWRPPVIGNLPPLFHGLSKEHFWGSIIFRMSYIKSKFVFLYFQPIVPNSELLGPSKTNRIFQAHWSPQILKESFHEFHSLCHLCALFQANPSLVLQLVFKWHDLKVLHHPCPSLWMLPSLSMSFLK